MARLRTPEESDDELPDIRGLILTAKAEKETWTPSLKTDTQNDRARAKRTPRKARVEAEEEEQVLTARKPAGHADNASANLILKTPRARAGETPARRQRALKGVQPNALLLPISAAIAEEPSARKKRVETGCSQAIKHTPKRAIKETVKSRATTPCPSDSEDDISELPTAPKIPSQSSTTSLNTTASSQPPRSRLTSPSKKNRIPHRQSLRESIDAFWSAEVVNEWNDQYSPRKILQSPKKPHHSRQQDSDLSNDDGEYISPSTARSPTKKTQSPTKRTKAALAARKAWDTSKLSLAESFVAELDATVTQGRISALSASTGGIKIVWSKKLNTTAGRAKWRREGTTKTSTTDGGATRTYIHHATVELAEKIIDTPDRLLNTLAHEFCHLATFMISNVRDNPHGREFKAWAAKVETAFQPHYPGLKISTRHAYEIEYKYVWECEGCGTEFKRHSRSVDPARQSCGGTRPAPRAKGKAGEYQVFVKEKFAEVKRANPGMGMPEVMEVLGKMYRERKEMGGASVGSEGGRDGGAVKGDGLDAVVRRLEVVTLDD
ncbi:hypothetical protein H2199_002033 [Coniosporium tulheliwenetii]|uniref:Uncharacterized protein n=1 Tax=Coniosporium tulheliwenetii TaxID=3383036 RepID=A0ACC2ZHP2_9PEZI|nr:hypothetical protein H2199_002033 [Cladosporium sp. JES 115]